MTGLRRLVLGVLAVTAAAAWTVAAGYLVAIGRFVASDTRCGGVVPQVDMEGGWIVIATVTAWAAPFVALALIRRRVWQIGLAALTMATGGYLVIEMFAHPVAFCF